MAYETTTVTIASGASLSGAVELTFGQVLVGIIMPAAWTAAVLTFQASMDGSTYNNVYATDGTEFTSQASTSRFIVLDPGDFAAVASLKVRSGTSAAAVNQGGARTIGLVTRGIA